MEDKEENILGKLAMPHVSSVRFPLKLWKLLGACKTGAIRWSCDGNSFVINKRTFQEQYLNRSCKTFKTQNMNSFIRQLNLYGFQKVHRRIPGHGYQKNWPELLEYRHEYFRRGYPELVSHVQRRLKEDESPYQETIAHVFYRPPPTMPLTQCLPVQNLENSCTLQSIQAQGNFVQSMLYGQKSPLQPTMKLPSSSTKSMEAPFMPVTLPLQVHASGFESCTSLDEQNSITVTYASPSSAPRVNQDLTFQPILPLPDVDREFQTIPVTLGSAGQDQTSNTLQLIVPPNIQPVACGSDTFVQGCNESNEVHTINPEDLTSTLYIPKIASCTNNIVME